MMIFEIFSRVFELGKIKVPDEEFRQGGQQSALSP
jgi:hypothetical protein